MTILDMIELQTHESCDWSVIWMHGLGADGSDFVPVLPELGLDRSIRIRFVFPNAPAIPVTCNGGYVMPAWYDIISLDKNNREIDVNGIVKSRQQITRNRHDALKNGHLWSQIDHSQVSAGASLVICGRKLTTRRYRTAVHWSFVVAN